MELQEFSDQFDVLFNNITSNQAPGLNEYEKSVFLTKAETQLVRDYFNKRVDGYGGGFDGSEKRQYDFSCLLRTESLYNVNSYADRIGEAEKVDRRSLVFLFPENYFLSVNEILSDSRWQYSVLPIDYQEYQRLMLKPYNLPVKRGAWRLITDKKNCNFSRVYVTTTVDNEEVNTETDYTFLSTWADQKRNLEVTIKSHDSTDTEIRDGISADTLLPYYTDNTLWFTLSSDPAVLCKMQVSKAWGNDNLTYEVVVDIKMNNDPDDEEVAEAIKDGFEQYSNLVNIRTATSTLAKVARHTDGFVNLVAPSSLQNFMVMVSNPDGMTFTTEVIRLPMVEIIGKFRGDVKYQMRYVRTLKPIILDDLTNYGDDLKIDGYQEAMECELPKEMHEEILERAVTLAKIAWQGGTATMAGAQSNNRD
jgi:hypothetical protein